MDYDSWRIFLEELTWRKRLNLEYVIEKLESTGKPYIINTTINRGGSMEKNTLRLGITQAL